LNAIRFVLALPIAASLLAVPALAQSSGQSSPPMQGTPPGTSPADQSMMAGMTKMNHAMSAAPLTGNADQDFVAMMLPHHQGAVSMAQVELQYGHDPEMRRLAKSIIAAQDKEIAEMRAWQQRHSKP
jgi:uncharacterized protein (DUF305 family)